MPVAKMLMTVPAMTWLTLYFMERIPKIKAINAPR